MSIQRTLPAGRPVGGKAMHGFGDTLGSHTDTCLDKPERKRLGIVPQAVRAFLKHMDLAAVCRLDPEFGLCAGQGSQLFGADRAEAIPGCGLDLPLRFFLPESR